MNVSFVLTHPLMITSRLAPGVRIGDATISVEPAFWDRHGYVCAYWVDAPAGVLAKGQDLRVTLTAEESVSVDLPRKAISALLDYLDHDVELWQDRRGHDYFSARTAAWATEHRADIDDARAALTSDNSDG